MVDSAHGAQIARATRQLQLEQIAARAVEEFAIEADVLVAEYGPEVLVPGDGRRAARGAPTTGRRRSGARSTRSASSTSSARSIRWRWRSSPRWRSGTHSWSRSWRT